MASESSSHLPMPCPRWQACYTWLSRQLLSAGFSPWLDEHNLDPGVEWEAAIKKAVAESPVILVCISRRAVQEQGSRHKQIKIALDVAELQPEGTIYIVPVRLEECEVSVRVV